MKLLILFSSAYLCGSIPFGVFVGRAHHVDIQRRGSGNIGFANVRRVLGWRAGLLTLAGDVIKGIVPVWLAQQLAGPTVAFFVGVAAILGHLFPLWLKFRGGKGIATGLGVLIILQPIAAAIGVFVYLVGCKWLHNSGLSSLLGIISVLIAGVAISPVDGWHDLILLTIGLWTLRKNIFGKVKSFDI